MDRNKEIESVKKLGEAIGYGNLMTLASALWRKSLKDKGWPTSGAFVPTCSLFIKKEFKNEQEEYIYDKLIESYESNLKVQ